MFRLCAKTLKDFSNSFRLEFKNAQPFPHVVIDDFLPHDFLRDVIDSLPTPELTDIKDNLGTKNKSTAHGTTSTDFPDPVHNLISEFNSRVFLDFLSELTDIGALLPDPYLHCGGIHQTRRTGYLGVHADYTYLQELRLDRRLNVLLYLNENWQEEWGGKLGLWKADGSQCVRAITPVANRLCIFATDDRSFHGHPEPLSAPEGIVRNSLAMYYYTVGRPKTDKVKYRNLSTRYLAPRGDEFVEGEPMRAVSGSGFKHYIKNWKRTRRGKKLIS